MAIKKENTPFYHSHDHRPYNFPKGFLWGTATSSHQVEGGNKNNDWWAWEQAGNIHGNDKSGKATDHYHRYEQDFDMIQKMNHNVHRLSIEWSRIEPEPGVWNCDAIQHYKNVLKALKKRNIKVMLTIHHFTNPQWFAKLGGWEYKYASFYFERFTQFIVPELEKYVDFWITINEPVVLTSMSYLEGLWPPGKKSLWSAQKVFRNLLKAHKKSYRAIHNYYHQNYKKKKPKVGIAKNFISFSSYNKSSFLNTIYTHHINQVWNHSFLRFSRKYHDFLGMNYYFHQRLERKKGTLFNLSFSTQIAKQRRELNDLGWEIYPAGIFSTLLDLKNYNLPIYITENGIASHNDNRRIRFLLSHLTEINRAINADVKVKGYCHWSLLDNFEWHLGFEPRFGIVNVNYKTFKRTPKKSARVLSEIAKENRIDHDLLQYLGHTPHHSEPEICKIFYTRQQLKKKKPKKLKITKKDKISLKSKKKKPTIKKTSVKKSPKAKKNKK